MVKNTLVEKAVKINFGDTIKDKNFFLSSFLKISKFKKKREREEPEQ